MQSTVTMFQLLLLSGSVGFIIAAGNTAYYLCSDAVTR